MKWFKAIPVILALSIGALTVNAQEVTPEATASQDPVITLERTVCFGFCPIYTVQIMADGTVLYHGENHVDTLGDVTQQIDPATVEMMVDAFADAGYFDWNTEYTHMTVTDMPSVITSVTRDGVTHQITRYGGDSSAPVALKFLENWIDEMAYINGLTGATYDIANISEGIESPIATLQQTPCFGMCPVYSVAIYESGTVVFTGSANTAALGVHVLNLEPASLTSIGVRANGLGYFGWQDAYDTMAITDQVYVTTSVRWEDQFKQITRYDGDPNAPVGLVWVEEMISQTVQELIGS